MSARLWDPEDVTKALSLRGTKTLAEIARILVRSPEQVRNLFKRQSEHRPTKSPVAAELMRVSSQDPPPVEVLFDRERRLNAPDSLSSRYLGDPKPGFPRWQSNATARRISLSLIVALAVVVSGAAHAGGRYAHGHFICGAVQRAHFGLPPAFNLALHWATLPHTFAHPGAVVVQSRKGRALGGGPGGHVSRIVSVISQCRAVVTDDKGTYSRNICRNLVAIVSPRG